MIQILHRNGRTVPVIVCDICGDMISDVADGAAVFNCTAEPNSKTQVLHAHKDACHDEAEKRFADPGWDELGLHLYRVGFNSGLNHEKEAARDKRLRDAGL